MNLSRLFIILLGFNWACVNTKPDEVKSIAPLGHLIEVAELKSIIQNDTIVIVDIRRPNDYSSGHLPGAINIWRNDIENDSMAYGGMIAPKRKIEQLLSSLGVTNKDFIVIYDNNASCDAARLWWVLDFYGFQRTALLNGGLKAWQEMGEVNKIIPNRRRAKFEFTSEMNSNRYIDRQELEKIYRNTNMKIIDTRTVAEYSGEHLKAGAFGQGRIPGSINIDWSEAMDYENQTFKNNTDLQQLYKAKGVDANSEIIVYCHSGVRSAHTTFVLSALLGYKNVRNYDGSWTEWSYHQLPSDRDSIKIKI